MKDIIQSLCFYCRGGGIIYRLVANCRVIFDSGSQRTYCTEASKDILNLKPIRCELILVAHRQISKKWCFEKYCS